MSCSSCCCPQVSGPQPCKCGARACCCKTCNSNPCSCRCSTSTVECETLTSQIENFTKQFFGVVVKTEVDGGVIWTLPCDLETGLVNNPRLSDEGLACYFKRLFEQGIVGLTGPQGEEGNSGTNGNNAYTVTLESYNQPSSGSPNVQVRTAYNPAIVAGIQIFIQTSGYFTVNSTDNAGTLFLSLVQAAAGAPAVITAGKLVTPSGPQGVPGTGTQGPQGDTGPQGTSGESFTVNNGQFHTNVGTDEVPGVIYAAVDFTSGVAEVSLSAQGEYHLTATVGLLGKGTVLPGDIVEVKLRDVTNNTDVEGSEQGQSNIQDIERTQVVISCIYQTDSPNHIVRLFAKSSTAGAIDIVANRTVITFVRIS